MENKNCEYPQCTLDGCNPLCGNSSSKKPDCQACGQPYENHTWFTLSNGGMAYKDHGRCRNSDHRTSYTPKEDRKPDASLAPQKPVRERPFSLFDPKTMKYSGFVVLAGGRPIGIDSDSGGYPWVPTDWRLAHIWTVQADAEKYVQLFRTSSPVGPMTVHPMELTVGPEINHTPAASPALRCPTCGSDKVVPDTNNGVGNTHSCGVCFTDFTPGKRRIRPFSLFDNVLG